MNAGLITAAAHRQHAAHGAQKTMKSTHNFLESRSLAKALEHDDKASSMRDWWKKTSGLQTVQNWVKKYHQHPAGWGALLLIHGVPEVSQRLRTKVDNFAIYSALFLATAIAALLSPPDKIISCEGGFECEVRKRIFFYFLIIGVVSQMLCIMLAMTFGNALNETARDCDVFRMFSPAGNGFHATKKVERAYFTGVGVTFFAMLAPVQCYMGWEAVIFSVPCVAVAWKIYHDTSGALFSSASIVNYWKTGQQPGDPYDLDILIRAFEQEVKSAQETGHDWDDLEASLVHDNPDLSAQAMSDAGEDTPLKQGHSARICDYTHPSSDRRGRGCLG